MCHYSIFRTRTSKQLSHANENMWQCQTRSISMVWPAHQYSIRHRNHFSGLSKFYLPATKKYNEERTNKQINKRMNGRTNGRTKEWKNERTNKWKNHRMRTDTHTHTCVQHKMRSRSKCNRKPSFTSRDCIGLSGLWPMSSQAVITSRNCIQFRTLTETFEACCRR